MRHLITLLCGFALSGAVHAQTPEASDSSSLELAAMMAEMDSVENSYTYATGNIPIADGVATLNIPEGFKFLDAAQSRQVIVELWGNPPGAAEDVLGLILPEEAGVLDNPYAFVVEYDPMGYVSDEDADDIDYDEMLEEMKRDNATANEQRLEQGYDRLTLLGWASPPYYDGEKKVLHWAKELYAEGADGNTLNYNVRVLGRKGVLVLNAVAAMEYLDEVKANIPAVLNMASFNAGHTYAEFDSNVDEVAAWTVGGLVAGKVLAKAGILALLLKNIKLVLIGLAAAGGALWKFFSGKRKSEEPPAPTA